jgi:hypothetical protein
MHAHEYFCKFLLFNNKCASFARQINSDFRVRQTDFAEKEP